MKIIFFLNCIFVWLNAGPLVFPKDFFNRNGTSPGPLQWLPWPPCPALPCLSPHTDKHYRERPVTWRIFQALPTETNRHCCFNTSGCSWPSDTVKSPGSPSMSWKSCAKKIPGPGSCEAPCVKSKSQNWDPTSWKSRPKRFQVSILEIVSVKIQAPKLRSQVLKIIS
jgi:hypothetical protein